MGARFRKVAECCHPSTVSVISDGLERVICEDCGDVSFRYESWVSGEVARSDFPRHTEDRFLKKLIGLTEEDNIEVSSFSAELK